jgi:hypothetical protein
VNGRKKKEKEKKKKRAAADTRQFLREWLQPRATTFAWRSDAGRSTRTKLPTDARCKTEGSNEEETGEGFDDAECKERRRPAEVRRRRKGGRGREGQHVASKQKGN